MMTNDREARLGLYLHIPFCLSKCLYCDFYSGVYSEETRLRYVKALCAHLQSAAPSVAGYEVDSIYFGGGTPTLLSAMQFEELMRTVRDCYRVTADAEISAECNPAASADRLLCGMREAGINRLSIGVQSANGTELTALGRRHTFSDFVQTVRAARAAGFDNLSADVMFGIPHQTLQSFGETLDAVTALPLAHLSAYDLRVEEGTPFFKRRASLCLPEEDLAADMQLLAVEKLTQAGFDHYEISNYAKQGYACRHNLRYWLGKPYLGFGPGSHSFFGGDRFAFPRDLSAYLHAADSSSFSSLVKDRRHISGKEAREEYVMLRMRLLCGIDEEAFRLRFGIDPQQAYGDFSPLIRGGFLRRENGRLAFTERGLLVSNTILSDWLDFSTSE